MVTERARSTDIFKVFCKVKIGRVSIRVCVTYPVLKILIGSTVTTIEEVQVCTHSSLNREHHRHHLKSEGRTNLKGITRQDLFTEDRIKIPKFSGEVVLK